MVVILSNFIPSNTSPDYAPPDDKDEDDDSVYYQDDEVIDAFDFDPPDLLNAIDDGGSTKKFGEVINFYHPCSYYDIPKQLFDIVMILSLT